MIACREQMMLLDGLRARERQIWPDSCDAGVEIERLNADALRDAIKELRDFRVYRWDGTGQWSETYRIPIEYEADMIAGMEIRLSYVNIRGKKFITSTSRRKTWRER